MDPIHDIDALVVSYDDFVSKIVERPCDEILTSKFSALIHAVEAAAKVDEFSQNHLGSKDGLFIDVMVKSLANTQLITACGMAKETVVGAILGSLSAISRRELDKETASQSNISIVAGHIETILRVMVEFIEARDAAFHSCRLIMVLASDSSERQFLLAKHGATGAVVKAMNIHSADPGVAEYSYRAARNLSIDDDITAKLVEDGICAALVTVFKNHKYAKNCEVGEAFLWTTVNLSCDDRVGTLLGSAGCCECVVEAAQFLTHVHSAMAAACSAIRNLSSAGAYNYARFAECNGAGILLDCIRAQANSLEIVEAGLFAVSNLACDKGIARQLCSLGVLDLILSCLSDLKGQTATLEASRAYLAFGPIAESSLFVFRNLATTDSETQLQLGSAGVIELIGQLMQQYMDRGGMIELSLGALANILDSNESNKLRAQSSGIFAIAFEALGKHDQDSDFMESWLRFVAVAAKDCETNRPGLLALNAPELAAKSVYTHWGEPDVFRLCCEVLLHLHYVTEGQRAVLAEAGFLLDESRTRALPPSRNIKEMIAAWKISDFYTPPEGEVPSVGLSGLDSAAATAEKVGRTDAATVAAEGDANEEAAEVGNDRVMNAALTSIIAQLSAAGASVEVAPEESAEHGDGKPAKLGDLEN